MYGTGTDTTDLREKERNFINFIIIDGSDDCHTAYPLISKRIDIVSSENQLTNAGSPCITIKDKFKGTHIVVFQKDESESIGICNMSSNKSLHVFVNSFEIKTKEDIDVSKKDDFYIYIALNDNNCCILGSSRDYSNRDWESYPLYQRLSENKSGFVRIGRDEENEISIDNHTVSREHGYFQLKQDKVYFYERAENPLGNKLNGEPINKSCEVPDRSLLILGAAAFIYLNGILLYSPFNNGCELSIVGLSKIVKPLFKKKKILLQDVNLTIPGNSLVAVMGPSGAGKSTLIDLIRQNERKTAGSIQLNGNEITQALEFQRCMGYVHQNNLLRDKLNVYETIQYYARLRIGDSISPERIDNRIDEVLSRMNLQNHKESKIAVLSGGQKKKVAIACELVCDPQVLFLDEPASGLDPASEEEIMGILKDLTRDKKKGKTILVITHSLLHFEEFDKIIFIGKSERDDIGYLCYYGSPKGIFSHFNVEDNSFIEIYEHAVKMPDVAANAYKERYFKEGSS